MNESPKIDCVSFFLSLAASAQVHLGVIADPATGKKEKQLPLAKQTIDLLELLEGKTKGNLTSEEERVLGQLLANLRMLYVEGSK